MRSVELISVGERGDMGRREIVRVPCWAHRVVGRLLLLLGRSVSRKGVVSRVGQLRTTSGHLMGHVRPGGLDPYSSRRLGRHLDNNVETRITEPLPMDGDINKKAKRRR